MTNENQTENKKERLEILVVEDKEENLLTIPSIKEKGHILTIARDFGEAVKSLNGAKYDVVLSDMMLPLGEGGTHIQGSRYKEAPLGYSVVLYAAKKRIPLIAIYTDMDHHAGPIAATFDLFKDDKSPVGRDCFKINESTVYMFDIRDWVARPGLFLFPDGSIKKEAWGEEKQIKNWAYVLEALLGNRTREQAENEIQQLNQL